MDREGETERQKESEIESQLRTQYPPFLTTGLAERGLWVLDCWRARKKVGRRERRQEEEKGWQGKSAKETFGARKQVRFVKNIAGCTCSSSASCNCLSLAAFLSSLSCSLLFSTSLRCALKARATSRRSRSRLSISSSSNNTGMPPRDLGKEKNTEDHENGFTFFTD